MLVLRARYVFPVDGPPLRDGLVAVDRNRIVAIGDESSLVAREFGAAAQDLGNVALLPGLINPHTHLEFSDLLTPLGTPGMAFADWIRQVVQVRQQRTAPSDPIAKGIFESSALGVTALGEIASTPWHRSTNWPLEITQFCEVIGFRSGADDARFAAALRATASSGEGGLAWTDSFRPGLSPHAPYTVRPELIQQLVRRSAERRIPLALHLAETREELQLLRAGVGPLVELMTSLGPWDAGAIPAGARPMEYLQMLSEAERALVIHGNYLADDEINFLAEHSDRLAVIYCPRTHAFFQHQPYPLMKMLSSGVNVALGTDSRASNPDLSILAEFQFAAQYHPAVSPADVLRLITANAAKALGREEEIGTLSSGKFADLAVIALPQFSTQDPHELLLDETTKPIATFFRGSPCSHQTSP
ncbi:MAG: amidohydrolase family protein [Pirellulales bacterium]|nr:amidohydrolase family protein [Pirellulales bacterium]